MEKVKLGKYLHYKNKYYQVIGVGKHSETLEELVFYIKLDNHTLWVRPIKMFTESVVVDGKEIPRFKFVEK